MRERCGGCERPLSVCLCAHLPSPPFHAARTRLLLLQHPHESRHKLSTLPILSACLSKHCHTILHGRCLSSTNPRNPHNPNNPDNPHNPNNPDNPDNPNIPDSPTHLLLDPAAHILLLFPSRSAQPIAEWFAQHAASCPHCHDHDHDHDHDHGDGDGARPPHILLLAFDATWQHAREMVKASAPFLDSLRNKSKSKKNVVHVCLPFDQRQSGPSICESESILRKEPFGGCMSTMEAVASCLKELEPNGSHIYAKLLSVLQAMVRCQSSNIRVHKVRT